MKSTADVIERLRSAGHRITKVRSGVIDILSRGRSPLSAQEVISALKKRGIDANKTTIYRETDFLLKEQVIQEIDLLDGKKRYELLVEGHHHHHIICTGCGSIQCIDACSNFEEMERTIFRDHRFKVMSHSLEFFGLCGDCDRNPAGKIINARRRET